MPLCIFNLLSIKYSTSHTCWILFFTCLQSETVAFSILRRSVSQTFLPVDFPNFRCIKSWFNSFLTIKCSLFFLCFPHCVSAYESAKVLVFIQVKVHLCEFIWLYSWPHLPFTWYSLLLTMPKCSYTRNWYLWKCHPGNRLCQINNTQCAFTHTCTLL